MAFAMMVVLLLALPSQYTNGEDYCSRTEKGRIECIPCSELCPRTQQPCNTSYSFCPKQCGNSIEAGECLDVCENNCRDGRCEYTNGRMDISCAECEPEFTGKVCQELCPPQCLECHQFNETCISCKGNYIAPNCNETHETTKVTSATSPSTDVSIHNCSDNCTTCNVTSGICKKCKKGRYGHKCQHLCVHCNISLCALHEACFECISDLSIPVCATSTQSPNTTMAQHASEIFQTYDPKDYLPVIYGLSSALFLTLCSVCVCLVIRIQHKQKSEVRPFQQENRITDNQSSAGSLTVNEGYAYIKDTDIEPNFSRQDANRQLLCHQSYESVGNMSAMTEDIESSTSVSSTIFGNLFELNEVSHERNQHDETKRQPNQNMLCRSSDENSRHTSRYLTPVLIGRNIK